jgi:hypothetical protein
MAVWLSDVDEERQHVHWAIPLPLQREFLVFIATLPKFSGAFLATVPCVRERKKRKR